MAFTPGQMVGRYEILGRVAQGGLGEVYKARDTRLLRPVAIKLLRNPDTAGFEREGHALAALKSPHICQIFDVGPDYLVLEFVEGRVPRGPLPPDEVLRIATEVCDALEVAHRQGILHRDLKPDNIMLTENGAKLLDFGLAKLRRGNDADVTQTLAGTISGTAAFMSPEQAQGQDLDERSDIFSLGATLYNLISGKYPFKGDSLVGMLHSVIYDNPAPLASPLAPIIMRCLAKDRVERFQSAAHVKAALLESKPLSTGSSQSGASIAVLPFLNMSSDKEQEYFSDGLAEEIISALVKAPDLKVIARTSAFAFKGLNIDVRQIAEKLGVTHVLEGSVRKSGNRIRVTAQLIAANDGAHLWSERFDRQLADVFEIQDEIAGSIAETLASKLKPDATPRRHVPKMAAHDALLRARFHEWRMTAEGAEQATRLYEEAIAIDPEYALAYADYADHLEGLSVLALAPARKMMSLADRLAQRALELDPSIAEAHAVLLIRAIGYDYDRNDAERRIALIDASESISAWVQAKVAVGVFVLGRTAEAIQRLQRALEADPLHPVTRAFTAMCLSSLEKYGEAEAQLRYTLDLNPNFQIGNDVLAGLYAAEGRFEEALPYARRAHEAGPWKASDLGQYAGLLSVLGHQQESSLVLNRMPAVDRYGTAMGWAMYHLMRGDLADAANWFEKAFDERMQGLKLRLLSGIGAPLRRSPYWPKLAEVMNLPVSRQATRDLTSERAGETAATTRSARAPQ